MLLIVSCMSWFVWPEEENVHGLDRREEGSHEPNRALASSDVRSEEGSHEPNLVPDRCEQYAHVLPPL